MIEPSICWKQAIIIGATKISIIKLMIVVTKIFGEMQNQLKLKIHEFILLAIVVVTSKNLKQIIPIMTSVIIKSKSQ